MSETVSQPLLADIFRFLGSSLEYPQAAWLDREYLAGFSDLLQELDWQEALDEMQALPANPDRLLEWLQIEYTRLYINGIPAAVAPPYGSVHRRGEGMLNSRSTEKTREFYRLHGFDLAEAQGLADYLPLELEFLALLLESERSGEAEVFLRDHFRPWFGVFRDRVREGAQLPFYWILIELIDFFTKEEEEYGY
jgi:TorA maturation chaperone TorD